MLTADPDDGEVEAEWRDPILPYMTSPTWMPMAVISGARPVSLFFFVQGNHGLTGSATACNRFAQADGCYAENGEQTVADEFQYFPAMSRNRIRHRVEIAIQKIDDIIARPVSEIRVKSRKSQIMMAARTVARFRAWWRRQNELAGMRPDIGSSSVRASRFLIRISLTSAKNRQQFQQAGDMRASKPRAGRSQGHHMALAERVVQWPCHIVGQAFRPHLVIDGVLRPAGDRVRDFAHLVAPSWSSLAGLLMYSDRSLTSVVYSRDLASCIPSPK